MAEFTEHYEDCRDAGVVCPACGTVVNETRYCYRDEEHRSNFFHCNACSFLFARPVLIPDLTERQMDGVDNAEMFNSKLLKWLYVTLFIKREIRNIQRFREVSALRLLDVGCGTGWTSKVYQDNDFLVTGLEPSKVRAEIARRKYGLNVINDYLENMPSDAQYDIIVLRHIIEHFAEPEKVMEKVRDMLHEDGLVVVIVPNINCLGRYIFGTRWTWVLPWHCNFFTPKSVRALMARAGLRILRSYQTPSPLYFPDSLLRAFPNHFLKLLVSRNKVAAMLLSAPVATLGVLLGMGDNINLFANKQDLSWQLAVDRSDRRCLESQT